ncbi:uncharacterized protein [Mytilus edulis]|uniref:uncharacterized protein n=1 Tax=Mytilus edulis TaxID=6550 RepID=UPI0039EEA508
MGQRFRSSIEEICCSNFELRDGICVECKVGFYSKGGRTCYMCPESRYGYKCGRICKCRTTERCDHEVGCVQVLISTEAVLPDDHTEGTDVMPLSLLHIVNISIVSILFLLLVCVSLMYVCWKYEISCKKRERRTVQSSTNHTNRSRNHAHQGEAHEYVEINDGRLNRGSSIYYIHRARNSGSSTRGSGICGVDSDGYLNPYHALKSNEIEMDYA